MKMLELNYVTGNWAKISSARQKLEPLGIQVNQIKMDCIEIQADSIEEVAIYSSKYAAEKIGGMVLKNDSGLKIKALNNFPDAYTHYAEDTLGYEGILKLMEGIEDRSAEFVECLALTLENGETKVFKSITSGKIALEESGTYGWGYDKIFIPDGCDKTFANYEDEERWKLWNGDGYTLLAEYLKNINK